AAQAPRYLQAHNLWPLGQGCTDYLGLFLGNVKQEAVGVLSDKSDSLQNLVLGLLSEARQLRHAIIFTGLHQLIHIGDVELIVDGIDLLWSDTRNAHHIKFDLRRTGAELFEKGDLTCVDSLLDAFDNR